MSRYGDSSNRWDRDRFDRFGRSPPQLPEPPRRFEDDFRFSERERPGRREVLVDERRESRGSRGAYDERERIFRETYGGRRRTDRELFGDVDPRDIADMAVQPYRGESKEKDLEITIKESRGGRPGMIRRQSSLDTFNRRPIPRYDREDRLPPNVAIPLPVRRREEDSYREVEVKRERSIHRRGGAKSRVSSVSSSSSESTVVERARAGFKKGKTRMPKRLVIKDAVLDLGYPFVEEERFYVLQVALEKEQIDEVIELSKTYRSSGNYESFRYEERVEDASEGASRNNERVGRETIIREEFINPPSDFLRAEAPRRARSHLRAHSPSIESSISQRSSRSRARSTVLPGPDYFEERKTVVEERSPGALVLQRTETRSDNEIQAEILRLEAERKALRLERGDEDVQLALVREERPRRDLYDSSERDRSPPRNVVRVEKDRKERRKARIVAAAMATLT